MLKKTILLRIFSVLILMVLVAACGSYMNQPLKPNRAILGPETQARLKLLNLPKPQEKIVTAVYKFRDQTGQYKPTEAGSTSWSTAVTQGATTILMRVLEESGWFIPIERENMANLLNERKIIRMSRAQYEKSDQNNESLLPPLLFAGVLLEGGIISYDTNILTGGIGIRYMGADLSGQYREDRVSIYIRAVSSSNGRVLKTVYTTKSILSQEVSTGIFRYLTPTRILESETGLTYNEPTEICVTEAIEKAVECLIIEGVKDKLWGLENPGDTASVAFKDYEKEKLIDCNTDPVGRFFNKKNRGQLMMGAKIGSSSYSGDFSKSLIRPQLSFLGGVAFNPHIYFDSEVGYRGLMVQKKVDDYSLYADLSLRYIFLPFDKLTPYFGLGGGVDYNTLEVGLSENKIMPFMGGKFGLEYMVGSKLGLSVSSGLNYYLNDKFDGSKAGDYNDFNWGISLGLRYYISFSK